ncbi:unnamed protein product [Amoebophrya sp. A120]|nr:unnamed protein product [Amoebophrya sp. A120]|eukprot:GSA120T00016814001.1
MAYSKRAGSGDAEDDNFYCELELCHASTTAPNEARCNSDGDEASNEPHSTSENEADQHGGTRPERTVTEVVESSARTDDDRQEDPLKQLPTLLIGYRKSGYAIRFSPKRLVITKRDRRGRLLPRIVEYCNVNFSSKAAFSDCVAGGSHERSSCSSSTRPRPTKRSTEEETPATEGAREQGPFRGSAFCDFEKALLEEKVHEKNYEAGNAAPGDHDATRRRDGWNTVVDDGVPPPRPWLYKLVRDGPDPDNFGLDAETYPHGILVAKLDEDTGEFCLKDRLFILSDDNRVGIFGDFSREGKLERGRYCTMEGSSCAREDEAEAQEPQAPAPPLIDVLTDLRPLYEEFRRYAVLTEEERSRTTTGAVSNSKCSFLFDAFIAAFRRNFRDRMEASLCGSYKNFYEKMKESSCRGGLRDKNISGGEILLPGNKDGCLLESQSLFGEDLTTETSLGRFPLLPDAFEERAVCVKAAGYSKFDDNDVGGQQEEASTPSTKGEGAADSDGGSTMVKKKTSLKNYENNPDPGEGLFAKKRFGKGELVAFYNGVRISQAVCDGRDWKENGNCVTLWKDEKVDASSSDGASHAATSSSTPGGGGGGVVIDIPVSHNRLTDYRATVGHKANHSQKKVNARYGPYTAHPRFGDIVCIRAVKAIGVGEEVFCDYGYVENSGGKEVTKENKAASEKGEKVPSHCREKDVNQTAPDWWHPDL